MGWAGIPALCLAALLALGIALLPSGWALLGVLAGIIGVATLVRPKLGLLLLVAAVPFGAVRQVSVGPMNVGLTEALLALVFGAWLVRRVAMGRGRTRQPWPTLTMPLTILLITMCLSLLGSTSLSHSLKEILKWLEVLALYLLVAEELDERWARALVAVLLVTGALVALHGIYQFLSGVGPEGFVLFGRFMRAYGTFEQPNPYGGYLGLTLPLAAGLVVAGALRVGGRVGRRWILGAAACGLLMVAALAMSWSRGAWLGAAAAIAVMALAIAARSERAAARGAVLGVVLAYVLVAGGVLRIPPALAQRAGGFVADLGVRDVRGIEVTDANFAVLERLAHWQAALGMWTEHPWLGVGIGNYEVTYPGYALPLWPLALGHAHNYYLNVAAETGVLGLAAYLLLCGAALVSVWRATQRARGWWWGVVLGILGVVAHLGVHNLFDNLYVHAMYLHMAMLLGVLAVYEQNQRLDR